MLLISSQSLLRQRILPDSHPAKPLKALYQNRHFPQPPIFPSPGAGKITARRAENSPNSHKINKFATCPSPRLIFSITPNPAESIPWRLNDHKIRLRIPVAPPQNPYLRGARFAQPVKPARIRRRVDGELQPLQQLLQRLIVQVTLKYAVLHPAPEILQRLEGVPPPAVVCHVVRNQVEHPSPSQYGANPAPSAPSRIPAASFSPSACH